MRMDRVNGRRWHKRSCNLFLITGSFVLASSKIFFCSFPPLPTHTRTHTQENTHTLPRLHRTHIAPSLHLQYLHLPFVLLFHPPQLKTAPPTPVDSYTSGHCTRNCSERGGEEKEEGTKEQESERKRGGGGRERASEYAEIHTPFPTNHTTTNAQTHLFRIHRKNIQPLQKSVRIFAAIALAASTTPPVRCCAVWS